MIAFELGMTPYQVQRFVLAFFGKHGLKYFIEHRHTTEVKGLGKFYFNKKTTKKFVKKK